MSAVVTMICYGKVHVLQHVLMSSYVSCALLLLLPVALVLLCSDGTLKSRCCHAQADAC